ncbi:hypothetical protein CsSME_00001160 [Camellia sinensis var. sinensis]
MTQNCRALKQHLEDLVAAGHLRDYIDQDKEVTEPGNPLPKPNIEHPPRLIINVIHGTATQEPEETLREEIAKAVQIQQVMSVEPVSKKVRALSKSPLCTVLFTRKDLEGIQHPHTDALIIIVGIEKRFDRTWSLQAAPHPSGSPVGRFQFTTRMAAWQNSVASRGRNKNPPNRVLGN